MTPARTIIIAGAGIGGLTASLALAARGFKVIVLEQAAKLEDIGAGIQLSPNATRVLLDLGLGESLKPHVVVPSEVRIHTSAGRDIARVPLGDFAAQRYGAPYWVIHRGDLQSVLVDAVRAFPEITFHLNAEVEKFTVGGGGITVHAVRDLSEIETSQDIGFEAIGTALIGADGLTSAVRYQHKSELHRGRTETDQPRYANRTAWRATMPASEIPENFRDMRVHLWLGRDAHLVHYPVKGGAAINIVAIARDDRSRPDWAAKQGAPAEVLAHYRDWSERARAVLSAPELWLRWPLFDRPSDGNWGRGPMTLLGDAAHPSLPFLAQGAAMAIEDAAVLADCLQTTPDDPELALRRYEDERRARTARIQRTARRNGRIYHLGGPVAALRNIALRRLSGESLLTRYDWLYDWRPNTEPE